MNKSVNDLRAIASSGGGLVLDAGRYSTNDLRAIASSSSGNGSRLVLKNVTGKSTDDLRSIASSGDGAVIFDFMS